MSAPILTRDASSNSKSFSLVILDVDDTLVPTTMRETVKHQFHIDIYNVLSDRSLKKLQLTIIKELNRLSTIIKQNNGGSNNHNVYFALLTTACNSRLNFLLNKKNGVFNALSDYFFKNNVIVRSAADLDPTATNTKIVSFLQSTWVKGAVERQMLGYYIENRHENIWFWRHSIIALLIDELELKMGINGSCKMVISISDNHDQTKAMRRLKTHNIDVKKIHFELVQFSSIYQLRKQWKWIGKHINRLVSGQVRKQTSKNPFASCFVVNMKDIYECDNTKYCSGEHQIAAISGYFKKWFHAKDVTGEHVVHLVNDIHHRLFYCNDKDNNESYIAFKNIVIDGLCCHRAFKRSLSNYCKFLQTEMTTS